MAGLTNRGSGTHDGRPFPPGDYQVVVLGSGPGGLQITYSLGRAGVNVAVLSQDPEPAGMFRRFPFFQRLISWTKPYAPAERGSRWYEWYDWNSLIGDEPEHRALVPEFMDGTSEFPSREEMERGLAAFAERGGVAIRTGCTWESTRRDGDGFVVETSDGEYRCPVLIVAVGMTEAWKPDIPGLEQVPHYVDLKEPSAYADKTVFVIGKRNSGFEIADGLLPWARQTILGSPRPAKLSILVHSPAAARARYMQPFEDHVLGGGTSVLDASIERVERTGSGWVVKASGTTRPGDMTFEVDECVAATGFGTPLRDLPALGVATFYQDRLPAQTPYWESTTVPNLYFAGSITQGAIGLKKYGIPSGSAAVHGFRYNARVLAGHVAERHFGIPRDCPTMKKEEVVDFLLSEATRAPELWNQRSYLCRVVTIDPDAGVFDEGIQPLQHFVDSQGPDCVAIAVETDEEGDIHPAVYVRERQGVDEHLLPGGPLHDFETAEHRAQLTSILKPLIEVG